MQGPQGPANAGAGSEGSGTGTEGWYPDTIGGSGAFRWWDGTQWTRAVSETLWESEPRHAPPYVPTPDRSRAALHPSTPPELDLDEEPNRRPLIVGLAVGAVLAVGVLAVVLYGAFGRGGGEPSRDGEGQAQHRAEQERADRASDGDTANGDTANGDPANGDQAGAEGWPAFRPLGEQWWTGDESVVPHATVRHVTTEENYAGKDDWLATILTGEVPTEVEPAAELETTAERVADWWAGIAFGPDRSPRYQPRRSGPTVVDGRPAHRLRVRMPYELDGLTATFDEVEIVVIDLGPDRRPGLYVAAVPNTHPELWKTADRAFDSLSIRK